MLHLLWKTAVEGIAESFTSNGSFKILLHLYLMYASENEKC